MLACPCVLNAVRLLNREHASTNEADHDVGCPNDLDSGATQPRSPESTIERSVVVDSDGVTSMQRYGKRRTFAGAKTNAWAKAEEQFDLAEVSHGAGVEVPGSDGREKSGTLVVVANFGLDMIGDQKSARMLADQIHPVNFEEIEKDGCICHYDCGRHPCFVPSTRAFYFGEFQQSGRFHAEFAG
jgi:hypothetical protein